MSLWSVYHLFRLVTGKERAWVTVTLSCWRRSAPELGWKMLLPIILIAAVTGAIVGIIVLTLRRQNRATPIAFGRFWPLRAG